MEEYRDFENKGIYVSADTKRDYHEVIQTSDQFH